MFEVDALSAVKLRVHFEKQFTETNSFFVLLY